MRASSGDAFGREFQGHSTLIVGGLRNVGPFCAIPTPMKAANSCGDAVLLGIRAVRRLACISGDRRLR